MSCPPRRFILSGASDDVPKEPRVYFNPPSVAESVPVPAALTASFWYSPAAKPRERVISASTARPQAPHGIFLRRAEGVRDSPPQPPAAPRPSRGLIAELGAATGALGRN